jgi:hypothetical protein
MVFLELIPELTGINSRSIKYVVFAYKIWYHDCVTHCDLPCFRLHLIICQALVITLFHGGRDYQLFNDNNNEAPYGRGGNGLLSIGGI